NIARVKPLGLVEIGLALIPLTSPARDIGQQFRNLASVGQELRCLLEITYRSVVILEAGVVVMPLGQYSLSKVRLKSECSLGCLPGLFSQSKRWLKTLDNVASRIHV